MEQVTEDNYFFQLSKFEQPLLDYYEAHPEAVQPEGKRNEVLGFIRQGLSDFSMSRTSISWGIPLPWDPEHVTYVWYDALINYATAVGFGVDPGDVRAALAGPVPPDRQGDPAVPRRLLARDAHGRGAPAAGVRVRPRLAAGRWREDEQDRTDPDRAGRSRRPSSAATASATTS